MTLIRRAILALALIAGITPAIAQVPAPVPALPDAVRNAGYSITSSICACAVGFQLYGDSTDFQNWVEVWLNGVRVNYNDPTFGWTITVPTQTLATRARPISDAVMTFNNAQTGTVWIIGARRPRRTSQFNEGGGVPTRNFNQVLSDIIATQREVWDKTNDMTGRGLFFPPGNPPVGTLPSPSVCAGGFLGFDATGLIPVCRSSSGPGNVNLPVVAGDTACFFGTSGLLQGCGFTASNIALFGAISNDNTKAAVNQAAFVAAYAATGSVNCSPGLTYYVQKITIPATATLMNGCNLIAAGTYAGNDGVVSVVNNTAGFTFANGSISANGATYPTTADILVTGSTNPTITNSNFPAGSKIIVSANNTNIRVLYNTITSYVYNAFFDSGGSTGVWIIGNKASGGTDTANLIWNGQAFIVVNGNDITMQHNSVVGSKFWSYSTQGSNHINISNNISRNSIRECITTQGSWGDISNNECSFDNTSTDYCMSFASSYMDVIGNLCFEPAYTGFYFNNELGGSLVSNTINAPVTTNNVGSGWAVVSLDGTTTGLTVSNNSVNDFHGTMSWYYWKAGGNPTGNYLYTNVGPTPLSGIFGGGLNTGSGTFYTQHLNVFGTIGGSPTIVTPLLSFGSGASSTIAATSANTGFQNNFSVSNSGTASNSGTTAASGANLAALTGGYLQMFVQGGGTPSASLSSGSGITGGLNIAALGGPLSLTSPQMTGPSVADTILHTNIAAPSSPAAGKVITWSDSTDLRFHDKNASGIIGTTVVADTGAANNYISAISAAGVITKSRPSCSSLSDASVFCNGTSATNLTGTLQAAQEPAHTGDVTNIAGSLALSIANNAVTLAKLATQSANTVLANATSGAAVPTAFAMGSCDTATKALQWTTNTGFACNSSITAADVANAPVITKVLTGFTSGAGTVSAADSILSALQKIDGNVALKAPLASPALTGTPTTTTAAVDTNTTQIASTAFVLGQAASATPLIDGTAAVGTSTRYARGDHIHPTDTTRAPLASPTFTGTVAAPTFAASTAVSAPSVTINGGIPHFLAFTLVGANFNSTADQPIAITFPTGFTRYRLGTVYVSNPSTSLTTAVGGLYTATSKGGIAVVPSSQVYSALTTNTSGANGSMLLLAGTNINTAVYNSATIYLSLTTPQGGAATADVTLTLNMLP